MTNDISFIIVYIIIKTVYGIRTTISKTNYFPNI